MRYTSARYALYQEDAKVVKGGCDDYPQGVRRITAPPSSVSRYLLLPDELLTPSHEINTASLSDFHSSQSHLITMSGTNAEFEAVEKAINDALLAGR